MIERQKLEHYDTTLIFLESSPEERKAIREGDGGAEREANVIVERTFLSYPAGESHSKTKMATATT